MQVQFIRRRISSGGHTAHDHCGWRLIVVAEPHTATARVGLSLMTPPVNIGLPNLRFCRRENIHLLELSNARILNRVNLVGDNAAPFGAVQYIKPIIGATVKLATELLGSLAALYSPIFEKDMDVSQRKIYH